MSLSYSHPSSFLPACSRHSLLLPHYFTFVHCHLAVPCSEAHSEPRRIDPSLGQCLWPQGGSSTAQGMGALPPGHLGDRGTVLRALDSKAPDPYNGGFIERRFYWLRWGFPRALLHQWQVNFFFFFLFNKELTSPRCHQETDAMPGSTRTGSSCAVSCSTLGKHPTRS